MWGVRCERKALRAKCSQDAASEHLKITEKESHMEHAKRGCKRQQQQQQQYRKAGISQFSRLARRCTSWGASEKRRTQQISELIA
jgi:hypothetical protein